LKREAGQAKGKKKGTKEKGREAKEIDQNRYQFLHSRRRQKKQKQKKRKGHPKDDVEKRRRTATKKAPEKGHSPGPRPRNLEFERIVSKNTGKKAREEGKHVEHDSIQNQNRENPTKEIPYSTAQLPPTRREMQESNLRTEPDWFLSRNLGVAKPGSQTVRSYLPGALNYKKTQRTEKKKSLT